MERDPSNVQRITGALLVDRFGGTERFWERRRPEMVAKRLLNKIGRQFFGDLVEIERALLSDEWEVAAG